MTPRLRALRPLPCRRGGALPHHGGRPRGDVADIVGEVVPNTQVTYSETPSPDARNYRVNCDKIARTLPAFQPQWTVKKGVEQLYYAYQTYGLTMDDFVGTRYQRIRTVRSLIESRELDCSLRWRVPASAGA